jgi:hypothetical protein
MIDLLKIENIITFLFTAPGLVAYIEALVRKPETLFNVRFCFKTGTQYSD